MPHLSHTGAHIVGSIVPGHLVAVEFVSIQGPVDDER